MTCRHSLLIGLTVVAMAIPGTLSAQDSCFAVTGRRASGTSQLVGLDERVRVEPRCEFGLATQGPYHSLAPFSGRDVDFLEIQHHLENQPGTHASGDPRVIYARPTSGRGSEVQHTLMLRYCAHYLLEEQLGFRVVPEAGDGGFRVERVAAAGCDANRLELRAVGGAARGRLWASEAGHTLNTGRRSLALPQGDWSIYAARPGSPVGLRIGVFRSQRVVTPLQNHLRVVGLRGASTEPPLLAARWDPGGPGMLLHPTPAAMSRGLLWPELRTAADAGVLWVAGRRGDETPVVLGTVELEGGERPAVRLSDSIVRMYMSSSYGEAGDAMVPDNHDWREIFSGLAVCLSPNYHDAVRVEVGSPVPDANACASFSGLAVLGQADAATPEGATEVCLAHGMQVITTDGPRQELGAPECFPVPAPGSTERGPARFAVAGDRLTLQGRGVCAMVDGRSVLPPEGEDAIVLPAGLLEIRRSGGEGCRSRQGLALLRIPVIDPTSEWHPVGLHTSGDPSAQTCPDASQGDSRTCPWRALDHDETDRFAFVEGRHELAFRLSTSGPTAASVYERTNHRQLTQTVPTLNGVEGDFGGARSSAVVAYVSRNDACPVDRPVSELRAESPVDPDGLLVDDTFHVFLLAVTGLDETATCLARASFRVRPSRAFVAITAGDFLGIEIGVLGDTQFAFFLSESSYALGFALPMAWVRLTPSIRFVALEVAINATAAAAFRPEELSRLGGSVSWALSFGIPEYLPRILTVGGMFILAADTSNAPSRANANAELNFFVGLNLATLIDLAGGR